VQRHDPIEKTDDEALVPETSGSGILVHHSRGAKQPLHRDMKSARVGLARSARPRGVGERIFDISFNGRTLLGNFDVFKEAAACGLLTDVQSLEPSAQGKLIFTLSRDSSTPWSRHRVVDEAWK